MSVPDLPIPGVTPGGSANDWLWADLLNAAIEARYQDSLTTVSDEADDRATGDANLQLQINNILTKFYGVLASDHGFDPAASAAENTTALQAAVDEAVTVGGYLVISPSSTEYEVDGTIQWDAADGGLIVFAHGATINYTGSSFLWHGQMQTATAGQPSWLFYGGTYKGTSAGVACFYGVDVRNGRWLDVEVEGFDTGTGWWFENEGIWCERNNILRSESRTNQHALKLSCYQSVVTNKERTGDVATLTVGAHRWRVGDRIEIMLDPADADYDSIPSSNYTVSAVTATTLSYITTGSGDLASTATDGVVAAAGSFARTTVVDMFVSGGTSGEALFHFDDPAAGAGVAVGPYDSLFSGIRGNIVGGSILIGLSSGAMGGTLIENIGVEASSGTIYIFRIPTGGGNGARPMFAGPKAYNSGAVQLYSTAPSGVLLQGMETVPGQEVGLVATTGAGAFAVLHVRQDGDTNARFEMRGSGGLQWGSGAAPFDTRIERGGVGRLDFLNDTKLVGDVGFYGTNPQPQPTITGVRDGNPAVADLLTQLDDVGLIVDSTTEGTPAGNTTTTLSATESNSTITMATLTGHTFTIPPGKTLHLTGIMIFRSAATTTGAGYGLLVTQPAGASGRAQGSVTFDLAVNASSIANGLRKGYKIDLAASSNVAVEIDSASVSSTALDHSAECCAVIHNAAAAHDTTVEVQFRSAVAASAVTAQIGTGAFGTLA